MHSILVLILILICVAYYYFSSKNKTASKNLNSLKVQNSEESQRSSDSKGSEKSFLPPIPNGYQIFSKNIPVAGISYHRDDAIRFARSSNQELSLQREPSNAYDKNAIKLIGLSGLNQYFIGYLPKELSAQIIGTEMFELVKARLGRIYINNNEFIDIQYQILGPKEDKKKFDDFLRKKSS